MGFCLYFSLIVYSATIYGKAKDEKTYVILRKLSSISKILIDYHCTHIVEIGEIRKMKNCGKLISNCFFMSMVSSCFM